MRAAVLSGGGLVVFVDGQGFMNKFEAVVRWAIPDGTGRAILLPIGEATPLDKHGPDVKPGTMDDRNASDFMEQEGPFRLAVFTTLGGSARLREPPFPFLNKTQTLFKFHYDHTTFTKGEDDLVLEGIKIVPRGS